MPAPDASRRVPPEALAELPAVREMEPPLEPVPADSASAPETPPVAWPDDI